MNKNFLSEMSPDLKKRLGSIESRPDLFETKVLKVLSEVKGSDCKNILVASRDPGSGNALLPVLKELVDDFSITAVTDGRAQELLQNNFKTEDVTPEESALGADEVIEKPDLVLMDLSSGEKGLDFYVVATFPEVPHVLVEDYYGTAAVLISELIKRNLPLPDKICVMDEGAKNLVIKKFPELDGRVEVTGQPAFDRLAKENVIEISANVRKRLFLQSSDKLVSYMSTMDEPEKIEQIADTLKGMGDNFYLIFRRHPRDNVSYDVYKKKFIDRGIKVIDSDGFTTDEIGAASDVVLTSWSTEGLHGIYRRKPTVHIIDPKYRIAEGLELPLVPVNLGASVGIENVDDLADVLPSLLDIKSDLSLSLFKKMEEHYPADGGNAKRVADIVRKYL